MSLLGIDVGQTGCKVAIFNNHGDVLSSEYQEHPLICPKDGWVEIDPNLIWNNIKNLIKTASQKVKKDKVRALSISCQGETFTPIDKNNDPLCNSIVSLDNRGKDYCKFWEQKLGKEKIFRITGMPLHSMYSINKILWIKDNLKDVYKKTKKFLCFEDYLFMKFGLTPTIDYSMAARTMAFDISNKIWSKEILESAEIDADFLPPAAPSGSIVGEICSKTAGELGLGKNVIAVTGGHDQACGAFGSGITEGKIAVDAIGTSDVMAPVLERICLSKNMLKNNYCCYPYVIKDKYMTLSINLTGGLMLKWYRDTFCYEEKQIAKSKGKDVYKIIDETAHGKPVNVFILPHFVGSGTPYLDPNSRGLIIGLNLETDKSRLSRAIMESSAYDNRLNLEVLESMGIEIDKIVAIGGGAKSSKWLQIKSNILGKKIVTLNNSEAASLGAALLAGIAVGDFKSPKHAVESAVHENEVFTPEPEIYKEYNKRYNIYKEIYLINAGLLHKIAELDD
jgi:xylulokinase